MTTNSLSEQSRAELLNVARAMVVGRMHLIEGVRRLSALRYDVGNPDDEVFHPIIATDDDTLSFPLGGVRAHWSSEALERSDRELDEYLTSARKDILEACEKIIRKFSSDS